MTSNPIQQYVQKYEPISLICLDMGTHIEVKYPFFLLRQFNKVMILPMCYEKKYIKPIKIKFVL